MPNAANLKVLARARALSIEVHRAFQNLHVRVNPELKSQFLRSIASIPRNIAEGCGRSSPLQFIQFVDYAIGSANEADECLAQITGLSLVSIHNQRRWHNEIAEIRMMLYGLRRHIKHKSNSLASDL